jgi:hypothetical protein
VIERTATPTRSAFRVTGSCPEAGRSPDGLSVGLALLLLSVLNLAEVLPRFLAAGTEVEVDEWLTGLGDHYIDLIPAEGTGVWGPRDLEI